MERIEGPIAYISRRMTFSSAHRLHSIHLSDEENAEVYGKCNRYNGHGHNYVLEVVVKGPICRRTGMVMNLVDLKHAMEKVVEKMDHRNIDKDISFFRDLGYPSTAENIAYFVWEEMKNAECFNNSIQLYEVKLNETENNVVIYKGESMY